MHSVFSRNYKVDNQVPKAQTIFQWRVCKGTLAIGLDALFIPWSRNSSSLKVFQKGMAFFSCFKCGFNGQDLHVRHL
jgi:hypothetical protein